MLIQGIIPPPEKIKTFIKKQNPKWISFFLIMVLVAQTISGLLFLPRVEKAQASSGTWTQTDWTGGSGQSAWSDATKYNAITGEGLYNSTDLRMKINADTVIGQADFTTGVSANTVIGPQTYTLNNPYSTYTDGTKFFVADYTNNRVLIYNTIPTSSNTPADVVVGQADFNSVAANQGITPAANTLSDPRSIYTVGTKLIIADSGNYRVLVYNTIPASNNAFADVVIGQADFASVSAN